jgi:hypothetical protein
MRFAIFIRTAVTALALSGLACGEDDPLGPAADRNQPGSGTSTVRVQAEVEVEDESGGGYITELLVRVATPAGAAVSGAVVEITADGLGTVTIPEVQGSPGDYFVVRQGAPSGDIRLSVSRGTDAVGGVVVGFPGLHAITNPAQGSTQEAGEPMVVRWTVPSEAGSAEVETRDLQQIGLPDDGEFTIGGVDNPARTDQRIRVFRINQVTPAGATGGSFLRVSVRDTVEPVIVE